jgi:hypothetical protein
MKLWRNKIMNLFKKALLASAVAASFGASAAVVEPSTTAVQLSKEGVANGVAAFVGNFDFDITIGAEHPAGTTVTITFGESVDISGLTVTATVDNTTTAGKGDAGDIDFDYGNGSFTFDNVAIDTTDADAHKVTFDVSLGQPLSKNAAFNIAFTGATIDAEATASYSASHGGGVIDTGTGVVAEEVSQFKFSVSNALSKVITRNNNLLFTDTTTTDSIDLDLANDEGLEMSIGTVTYSAVISGDFTNIEVADVVVTGAAGGAAVTDAINGDEDEITIAAADVLNVATDGTTTTLGVDFDTTLGATDNIVATGAVTVEMTAISADFTGGNSVLAAAAAAGEWEVDATIINVPYLPVGFEGISSQVNLANEKSTAVDVIVSAIDDKGDVYPEVDLGYDLKANQVTKVSQADLMDLLSVPAGRKISVTFNIDANEGDVNAYAFTTSDAGRAEISTSQQRGN